MVIVFFFRDTVVQVHPGESWTVCSIAPAMIFRNNHKSISMGELQETLTPWNEKAHAAT